MAAAACVLRSVLHRSRNSRLLRILAEAGRSGARWRTALPLLGVALACSCGGDGAPPGSGNEVVVALASAPIHLDTRIGTDQASGRVFQLISSGLVTKTPAGELVPDLATSWEILDGGARYRFHLRRDAVFHDGRPFGAEDVVWTFRSMLDGTVVSPKRGGFPLLERVEEVDPHTVDFVLGEPYGALLPNLTSWVGILPRGAMPEEMNSQPVGTGPFRLIERRPDRVTVEAFERHWGGRPLIDRVVLREIPDSTVRALELRKGTVHLVVNDLPPDVVADFRERPRFKVVESPGSNYAYLGVNLEDPLLFDRRVRRALLLAIDRQRLVDHLWRGLGVVTETVLRPGHWAHHEGLEPTPYDPTAAMALLDESGYADPDGDGPLPRFRVTYKTSTDETALLQAQIVQSMLAAVGVEVEIRSHEFATFYNDIKQGNFQLFSMIWTGIVDPDFFTLILHSKSIPPAGANRGRYRNPEFDRVIDAGAQLTDRAERRHHYLRAQEIFAHDLPYLSLFIRVNAAVLPTELEGYENYPSGELHGLKRVFWRNPQPGTRSPAIGTP